MIYGINNSRIGLLLLLAVGCSASESPTNSKPAATAPTDIPPAAGEPIDDPAIPEPAIVAAPAVYRQPDDRPDVNERRLEEAGIHRLESKRLVLLTDRSPETVRHLLPLADAFYDFLETECGTLHPAENGSDFQVTGCLMEDERRFASSGLMSEPDNGVSPVLPETGPAGAEQNGELAPLSRLEKTAEFDHGLQRGYRFWMRHQTDEYYERHLLLHEFAHCFMHSDQQPPRNKVVRPLIPGIGPADASPQEGLTPLSRLPEWFLEGSAEVFATHRRDENEHHGGIPLLPETGAAQQRGLTPFVRFAIIPDGWNGFEGWGRISEIARHARRSNEGVPPRSDPAVTDELSLSGIPLLADVQNPPLSMRQDDGRYAFWWALGSLLRHHPDYSATWKQLCGARRTEDFAVILQQLQTRANRKLDYDWLLFAESLCEGFDVQRSFAQHADIAGSTVTLLADRGWQDSGWDFNAGDVCQVDCDGECCLATTEAPWISEPQGITIGWHRGRPLGEVQAVLVSPHTGVSRRLSIGPNRQIRIPRPGRLWLQINDSEASRHDNSGQFWVTIRPEPGHE